MFAKFWLSQVIGNSMVFWYRYTHDCGCKLNIVQVLTSAFTLGKPSRGFIAITHVKSNSKNSSGL